MKKILYILFILSVTLSSCIQRKNLIYMNDIQHDPPGKYELPIYHYQLQQGDILYVNVKTLETAYTSMFEEDRSMQQRATLGEAQAYLSGYTIDKEGQIDLPLLGKIDVLGLTVTQAKELVRQKLDNYFKEANVDVKLMSYRVTVLGEVGSNGVILNYQDQVTIFDVLAKAGNITDLGDRTNVLVMRPTQGEMKSFRVDLTSTSVLNSEAYYLLPNDVIMVEPINAKLVRLNSPAFSFGVSIFTTLLLVISLLN